MATDNKRAPRHFLSLLDLSADEFRALIARAGELKQLVDAGKAHNSLEGRTLG